jgi:hypothetical protein
VTVAKYLTSRDNPLTARVMVNRVWAMLFGTGLVETEEDFGTQGALPSHPELLDWLAVRFIDDGWSLKHLHRRILLSAVYQQASVVPREALVRDPDNRWLGRFSPRRLEAEAIRDALLFVGGRLDVAAGGPATADLNTPRRSLYVQTARWDRSSYSTLFDAANPDAPVESRTVSTVAPQALFLLNHNFLLDRSRDLADRLARDVPSDPVQRIHRAARLLFGRPARPEEVAILQDVLARSGKRGSDAWRDVAHVLLCCNEFVYLD